MIDVKNSDFAYTATLKLADMPVCKAQLKFPGVADIAINSRSFGTYVECVLSARAFMEDVVHDVNSQQTIQLTVAAEVNPLISGEEAKSKDWSSEEVARIWIFDKAHEETRSIYAVGQARIFALEKSDQQVLIN